ncbi:hypothetical protein M011DRAFT_470451 [Sporormia fimetaria CBS 119925]|uniref:Uncharacterized protein n=1 Tax=Sporormia fimetaria CBS 119925 TaxID=1340428 RepID=A0A6A6V1B3_9PLEO|nr:hypothetical protein M011DRAFT_470451 [Sporormia fimetaria CBS 119925]
MAADLDQGVYTDEYTFQVDLSTAFDKTYDFHTTWLPDIMAVMEFRRGNVGHGLVDEFALVSVSEDGKAIPELYNHYDVLVSESEGWTPSPIVKINGQPAAELALEWSSRFQLLEDHARYNDLFLSQPRISMNARQNRFGQGMAYAGETTVIEYKNGTIEELVNTVAMPPGRLDGIEDGEAFFKQFCNQGRPALEQPAQKRSLIINPRAAPRQLNPVLRDEGLQSEGVTRTKRQDVAEPSATGYPTPEILHSLAMVGGYYLSGQGYEDVAVLSVPSFHPETPATITEYQDLVGEFLTTASRAGKKKLVIDLRGNGGGVVFLGYDLFKQLFPSMEPYGGTRFRANAAFDLVGKALAEDLKDITYEMALADFRIYEAVMAAGETPKDPRIALAYQSIFNYRVPLTAEKDNFTSWEQLFGPHEVNGDQFTSIMRYDLNNFFSDDLALDVSGYASRKYQLARDQPFESKNIVLLQDGACGSTCAVFSEFMKVHGHVQQIVVGGKPELGPMQGVAGSKGAQVFNFQQIYDQAHNAYMMMTPEHQAAVNETELGQLLTAQRPLNRVAWANAQTPFAQVNLRDHIRMGDTTETPLEFVYEAADCRLFYTPDMIRDVEAVWKRTVDAQWGDRKKYCVEGSTGHPSSLSGGFRVEAQIGDGEGSWRNSAATLTSGVSGITVAVVVGFVSVFAFW